ncbi:MAG: hypothetical protein FWB88_02190 [Defluviitaleaceae bacterium]|nr:hypothetical protein [Defluviitaleaceae bacterium]MCL2239624.1 hypothetical protein [Defluviitaleaceae bacterium]
MKCVNHLLPKCVLTMFMAVTLLCVSAIAVYATHIIEADRDVDELMSIVHDLIIQRDKAHPLGSASRLPENLHFHPYFIDVITNFGTGTVCETTVTGRSRNELHFDDVIAMGYDPRLALLEEIGNILREAATQQNRMMGVEAPSSIIASWSGPNPLQTGFSVRFARDEYLVFVDIILDFMGIPRYMLRIGPSGRSFFLGFVPPSISYESGVVLSDEYCQPDSTEENEARSPTVIDMGRRISFLRLGAASFGTTVTDASGSPLGVVVNSAFNPSTGADVSLIRLNSNVVVSTLIPGTNTHLTNFVGPLPGLGQLPIINLRGCLAGAAPYIILHITTYNARLSIRILN